jgi:hypothetical protein
VARDGQRITREFRLVLRGTNLPPAAAPIQAHMNHTDTAWGGTWPTVMHPLYVDDAELIRDGRIARFTPSRPQESSEITLELTAVRCR